MSSSPPVACLADLEPGCTGLAAAQAWCRRQLGHYENFSVAGWLLPAGSRPALAAIYAFARFSDDLADEDPPLPAEGMSSLELRTWRLSRWRELVEGLPATAGRHPILLALTDALDRHALPREALLDLLSAFEQDLRVTGYGDDEALLDYCRRSAAPVGRLMLALFGLRAHAPRFGELAAWSDEICTGLQLANFWQDLSRDLPAGRCYVPRRRLARHGLPQTAAELLLTPVDLAPLQRELLAWARERIEAGLPLAGALGGRPGFAVRVFAGGGLAILGRAAQVGDLRRERPHTCALRKAGVAIRALAGQVLERNR
jgi:hydroxysqualene synthase